MAVTIKASLTDAERKRLVQFIMLLMQIDKRIKREKEEKVILRASLIRTLQRILWRKEFS